MNTRDTLIEAVRILRGDTGLFTAADMDVMHFGDKGSGEIEVTFKLYRRGLGFSDTVNDISEVIPLAKKMIGG